MPQLAIVIHEQIACEIDIRTLTRHPVFGWIVDQSFGQVFDQIFGTRPEFPGGVRGGAVAPPRVAGGVRGGRSPPRGRDGRTRRTTRDGRTDKKSFEKLEKTSKNKKKQKKNSKIWKKSKKNFSFPSFLLVFARFC